MYCKHCGKTIPENSKFCRYCGKNLASSSGEAVAEYDIEETQAPTEKSLKTKRNKWMGWVLVVFSILGIIGLIYTYSDESFSSTDTFGNSPIPYIIDLWLGIELIRQKEQYIKWVFIRVILGLIIWGLVAMASGEWGTIFAQAIYSLYFIYLIKAPLTEKALKLANYIILPLIVLSLFIFS